MKLNSFKELAAMYQLNLPNSQLPKGTIMNAYGQTAVLKSVNGSTAMEKNIPLRRF